MALTLPGKKVQALIIIIIALFISYFLYKLNVRDRILSLVSGKSVAELQFEQNEAAQAVELDTDKDGLRDWQEVLWKTDKDNFDTDGDGTLDGEEVSNGRDPAIAGPNDKLSDTRGVTSEDIKSFSDSINDDPTNLSGTLSKNLFAQFMALNTSGQYAQGSDEQLVKDALANIDTNIIPPQYTIQDVKVVDTNSSSLRAYGNAVAKLFAAISTSLNNNSSNEFAIAIYGSTIADFKSLSVPSTLGFNHLQMLNNLQTSYQAVVFINDYQNDPVKSLLALDTLTASSERGDKLNENIAIEMKKNGIIFNQEEPGKIWNNY